MGAPPPFKEETLGLVLWLGAEEFRGEVASEAVSWGDMGRLDTAERGRAPSPSTSTSGVRGAGSALGAALRMR